MSILLLAVFIFVVLQIMSVINHAVDNEGKYHYLAIPTIIVVIGMVIAIFIFGVKPTSAYAVGSVLWVFASGVVTSYQVEKAEIILVIAVIIISLFVFIIASTVTYHSALAMHFIFIPLLLKALHNLYLV